MGVDLEYRTSASLDDPARSKLSTAAKVTGELRVGTEPVQGFPERLKAHGLIDAARVRAMEAQGLGATAIAIGRAMPPPECTSDMRVRGARHLTRAAPQPPSPHKGREVVTALPVAWPTVATWDYWAMAGLVLTPGTTGPGPLISGCTKWRR
jgi:hypothetical protein